MNRRDRNAGIPVVEPLVAPRFDIEDDEGYNFLERFGFVVFRDVLTASEVWLYMTTPVWESKSKWLLYIPPCPTFKKLEEGRSLAWDFLEGIEDADINRNNPKSWENSACFPQQQFLEHLLTIACIRLARSLWQWHYRVWWSWAEQILVVQQRDPKGAANLFTNMGRRRGKSTMPVLRTKEKEKQRFKAPHNFTFQQQLVTSFDGFCMHRPFEYNQAFHTKTGWYHLDQNGHNKPHRICVQGFVNYYDSDPVSSIYLGSLNIMHFSLLILCCLFVLKQEDGGLVVVPRSQEIFNEIFKNRPELVSRGDFIPLPATAPVCHTNVFHFQRFLMGVLQLMPSPVICCFIPSE